MKTYIVELTAHLGRGTITYTTEVQAADDDAAVAIAEEQFDDEVNGGGGWSFDSSVEEME